MYLYKHIDIYIYIAKYILIIHKYLFLPIYNKNKNYEN